jgi:hypothetical protein
LPHKKIKRGDSYGHRSKKKPAGFSTGENPIRKKNKVSAGIRSNGALSAGVA